jgi:GNAT superfamily N-acetyltransferase
MVAPEGPKEDEVLYREATEADFPILIELFNKLDAYFRKFTYSFPVVENPGKLWLESFRRILGRFSIVYVAEYQGEVVGFVHARIKHVPDYLGSVTIGELKDEWIEPTARRLGIGEKLVRLAIEWCRQQGVYSLEGQILIGNEPIMKMLTGLGMKPELTQLRMKWEDYRG